MREVEWLKLTAHSPVQTVGRRHHPLVTHQGPSTEMPPLILEADLPRPLPLQGWVPANHPQARI